MKKYHIEIQREFDSTWCIMEQESEPTEEEIIRYIKDNLYIDDDPKYIEFIVTEI